MPNSCCGIMRDAGLVSAADYWRAYRGLTAVELPKQVSGVLRALGRSQFQPVTRLLWLIDRRLCAQSTIFELSTAVTGTGRLTQELVPDAPVTRVATIFTENLAQPALRNHHATASGLFEQPAGKMFDAGLLAQARVIEQP